MLFRPLFTIVGIIASVHAIQTDVKVIPATKPRSLGFRLTPRDICDETGGSVCDGNNPFTPLQTTSVEEFKVILNIY